MSNTNDTKNVEKVMKKQQRQFSIVYILGLIVFIVMIIFLEGNFFKNKKDSLNLNENVLKTPGVINIDTVDRGQALDKIIEDYEIFIEEINKLELSKLTEDSFEHVDDVYKFVNENYTHIATDNSIKLTRKGKEVYSCIIEEDITKVKLFSEKEYYLEFNNKEISFKINNVEYLIEVKDNQYYVECNYNLEGFNIYKEVYDSEWKFINILTKDENDNIYQGYFFENIEGYSLSDDKMKIIDDDDLEKEIPSTKFLEDNTSLYYTVVEYYFTDSKVKDILLVNYNEEFPLK